MKRTPLEILAFTVMVVSLIVIALSFSHIFGIGILSRLFPEIREPHRISLYPRFMIFIDVILPALLLVGVVYVILRSLKYVIARKLYNGYRPELALIVYSSLFAALTLQLLEACIQYSEHFRDSLLLVISIFMLLSLVIGIVTIIYRYFIDEKPQRLRDYVKATFLVLLFSCMTAGVVFVLNEFVHEVFS